MLRTPLLEEKVLCYTLMPPWDRLKLCGSPGRRRARDGCEWQAGISIYLITLLMASSFSTSAIFSLSTFCMFKCVSSTILYWLIKLFYYYHYYEPIMCSVFILCWSVHSRTFWLSLLIFPFKRHLSSIQLSNTNTFFIHSN